MLEFHYNDHIVEIKGLTILVFKRRRQKVIFMLSVILEVVIPPHDSDTPNGLVDGNIQAHTIWVNMVLILKNVQNNLKCIMLKFHYNNHIVEIKGLTILGFKRM